MSPQAKFLKLRHYLLALTISLLELRDCHALDALLYPGQSLSYNQTLLSENKTFELGFFSPGESGSYYVGVWYTILLPEEKTVVWVANRETPISDPSSCELKLLKNGDLALFDKSNRALIWSTESTPAAVDSAAAVARLLDDGNLIVTDSSSDDVVIWQSFDHPTDHWLPGAKLGYNKLEKTEQSPTAWRSAEDPSPSLFSLSVEPNGSSHLLLWNRTELYWSSGEWNGKSFGSVPEISLNIYVGNLTHVSNENESYSTYEQAVPGALTRFVVDSTGQYKQYVWRPNFTGWSLFWMSPPHQCQVYAFCGAFSSCSNTEIPLCRCLPGFEPVEPKDWFLGDHSSGCGRKRNLPCDESDGFVVMKQMRYSPDDDDAVVITASSEGSKGGGDHCRISCLKNCSCNAYAYGSKNGKCLQWIGKLYNFLQLPSDDSTGKEIRIRVSASDAKAHTNNRSSTLQIVLGAILGSSALLFVVITVFFLARKRLRKVTSFTTEGSLTVFKLRDLRIATKNFSDKLGEGGFGSVFKGTIPNSKVLVGVKRLKNVNVEEENQEKQFRAEVSTIGNIQHINLVRLLGFCAQGSERFLVYDYMVNGSLESKLFASKEGPIAYNNNNNNNPLLDWKTRHKIAVGTARGLAYLHEKCRDCIIHCDVKPENVLLDEEFNPKVADFGLAKLVGRDFTRVLTTVRGTLGYLAPEWLTGEPITVKADVFSYGMLLFEVVSGRRNRAQLSDGMYFPAAVAARVRAGEEVMGLLDPRLGGKADEEEVYRVCRVACWCIQDDERDRPTMGRVVQVLEGVLGVDVCRVNIPRLLQGFVDGDGGDWAEFESVVFVEDTSSSYTR